MENNKKSDKVVYSSPEMADIMVQRFAQYAEDFPDGVTHTYDTSGDRVD